MTKELTENSYMGALLRAALLLGDLHPATPVCEIMISGFCIQNHVRNLYPRCRIVAHTEQLSCPTSTPAATGEHYLILYPIIKSISS